MSNKLVRALPLYLAAHYAFAAAGLELTNGTVGRNLQTGTTIKLTEPAPPAGLTVTVKSGDPARLRLSKQQDTAGAGSIVLEVKPGFDETAEFWLQGLADKGEVAYTATAPGLSDAKATVTLAPSAIAIAGPFRAPKFQTTTGAEASNIVLYSVRLDSSLEVAQQQLLAGGLSLKLDVKSSDPAVGAITASPLTLDSATPSVATTFKPASPGSTTLTVNVPPGFSTPAQFATVVALVRTPSLGLTGDLIIGQNLEVSAVVGLGELAHPGGAHITLTSDDPSRLLLSRTATEVGTKSITIVIPEGGFNARFYLQALGKSGVVTYSGSAPGYVSRTAKIGLAPSGVVMTPSYNGPPDEAELVRKEGGKELPAFITHLSKPVPTPVSVWTVQLDPVTLRSADITVQPLRAGMSLKLAIENRDPAVGTVTTPVTIEGGTEHASADFKPLLLGSAVLSVVTPEGFTKSANSTSVKAVVKE